MLRANLVLYAAIAILIGSFFHELRWAAESLPRYRERRIGAPEERNLYRRARPLIESGDTVTARSLLERSLAIDPYAEAGYWLGRAWLREGDEARALEAFERYLRIDPTRLDAHRKRAELLVAAGRGQDARAALEEGLAYFRDAAVRHQPQHVADVEPVFNQKAVRVHAAYVAAVRGLERDLARLDPAGSATR